MSISIASAGEHAVIAGVNLKSDNDDLAFAESMRELANLAEACNIEVLAEISQKASHIHVAHYFGKGKIEELQALVTELEPDTVIFNDELSPSQIRNLEKALDCKVIDRTVLILDIFARRAQTKEAQLQVEIARLHYLLPRLIGYGLVLSRIGGSGGGLATRGAGETKLELDRRKIEDRISKLNQELEDLVQRRKNQRVARKKNNIPVVTLVGYTNAGKSSILNAYLDLMEGDGLGEDKNKRKSQQQASGVKTDSSDREGWDEEENKKKVFEKDMLFATLETSVRRINLADKKQFLLTDTVGFINKLPHHLVKAFRSTLEEVTEADLLLHIVDFSNPHYEEQIALTEATLADVGVKGIPMVYVFNKIDLVEGESFPNKESQVFVSAKTGQGMEELTEVIRSKIFADYVKAIMLIPHNRGDVVAALRQSATILDISYEEEGTVLNLEVSPIDYSRYQEFIVTG